MSPISLQSRAVTHLVKLAVLVIFIIVTLLGRPLIGTSLFAARAQVQPGLTLVGHLGGVSSIVAVVNHYAYINFGNELAVIDVSNPAEPTRVGYGLAAIASATDASVAGDLIFVATGDSLRIISIANPLNPVGIGSYDVLQQVKGVRVMGHYAYVTDQTGLRVLDVADPKQITEVGSFEMCYEIALDMASHYAYVVCPNCSFIGGYLDIIDVADPTQPVRAAFVNDSVDEAHGVAVGGNNAYVLTNNGVRVIDVTHPYTPVIGGFYATPGYPTSVSAVGAYALVADDSKTLSILNMTNPVSPTLTAVFKTPSSAVSMQLVGTRAYVADRGGGLLIIDLVDPANPILLGGYDEPDDIPALTLAGPLAYVPRIENVQILNLNNPTQPYRLSRFSTSGEALAVAVSGQYAYVAQGSQYLHIYDVSNPVLPAEVGTFRETAGRTCDVAVRGNFAFVLFCNGPLYILDVSDPHRPQLYNQAYFIIDSEPTRLTLSGNYAYVAEPDGYEGYGGGVRIIDISNLQSPHIVGFYDTPNWPTGVAIYNHYLLAADQGAGLEIIDIADPYQPQAITTYPIYASDVTVVGQLAFVAGGGGVHVLDISNPQLPVEVTSYTSTVISGAGRVTVNNGYVYVAAGSQGLFILQYGFRAYLPLLR